MPKIGKAGAAPNSVKGQINRLLMTAYITTAVIIAVFSLMLISVNSRYEEALLCANTAADFNKEFKSTLDLEMYNHVIRPRTAHSVEELPMQELDSAEEVLHRLEETTSLPDNRWRIRSMLDMCRNLRGYMIEIAETDTYDMRMELLERNIRGETGLTLLIEQYMHDFIDDEVQQLARLRRSIGAQSTALIVTAVLVAVLFSLGMLPRRSANCRTRRNTWDPTSPTGSRWKPILRNSGFLTGTLTAWRSGSGISWQSRWRTSARCTARSWSCFRHRSIRISSIIHWTPS